MQTESVSRLSKIEDAIWNGTPDCIFGLPLVDSLSWEGSIQHEVVKHGKHAQLLFPGSPKASTLDVAVVLLVKDEEDIILSNLSWLAFNGIRRFVISDNKSTDNTFAIISEFQKVHQECEIVLISDPLVSYIQSLKTTGMVRFALSIWPDIKWVFPVDADEFLVATNGFQSLSDLPSSIEALTIPKVNHFRSDVGNEVEETSPLIEMPIRNLLFCTPPKCAMRASLSLKVSGGNHKVFRVDGSTPKYHGGFSLGFYYREFQVRSFKHFLKKVVNGGKAISLAKSEGRAEGGDHWLLWFDILNNFGKAGLYKHYKQGFIRNTNLDFVHDPFTSCTLEC